MGDENTPLTAPEARHLLRRTGFGIPVNDAKNGKLNVGEFTGMPRGEAVDQLLDFRPKGFKPNGRSAEDAHNKWIKYLLRVKKGFQLQEKLTIFLHDHFATSVSVVDDPKMMAEQNKTLRRGCLGSFKELTRQIAIDPSMMDFLDTVRNKKEIPNENFGREYYELFTLQVLDLNGTPNYSQADIVQTARAYTGWHHDDKVGTHHLHEGEHDFSIEFLGRGPKEIFGPQAGFGNIGGFVAPQSFTVGGEGENEIDEIHEITFAHTDTDGENTVARALTYKLIEYFAHPLTPRPVPQAEKDVIDEIIATSGFDSTFELKPLLRALFTHDTFYETAGIAPFSPSTRKSVVWPIDYVVTILRMSGVKPSGRELNIQGGDFSEVLEHLANMGQVLLDPPSVFGFPRETETISSASLLARYNFVRNVTSARGKKRFKPEKIIDTSLSDPGDITDAVLNSLGMADQFSAAERTVLIDYLTDNGAVSSLNLDDYDIRNRKLHGLFALVFQSPAFLVH